MDDLQCRSSTTEPLGSSVLDRMTQLAPALDGFPVKQLLEIVVSAEQSDRAQARHLVNHCLVQWIAMLEDDLKSFPPSANETLSRIKSQQKNARDALFNLQTVLSQMDVVHRRRAPAVG